MTIIIIIIIVKRYNNIIIITLSLRRIHRPRNNASLVYHCGSVQSAYRVSRCSSTILCVAKVVPYERTKYTYVLPCLYFGVWPSGGSGPTVFREPPPPQRCGATVHSARQNFKYSWIGIPRRIIENITLLWNTHVRRMTDELYNDEII